MSRLEDKDKAGKRRKKDKTIANTRAKEAKALSPSMVIDSKNRFVKRHPLDCGKAKCFLCHGSKLMKSKRLKDRREEQKDKFDN